MGTDGAPEWLFEGRIAPLALAMVGSQATVPPSSPSILSAQKLIEEKQWFVLWLYKALAGSQFLQVALTNL